MKVKIGTNSETLQFAGDELVKYIKIMDNTLPEDFFVLLDVENMDTNKDCYVVDISQNGGRITASNERSVLFGVYAYLERLGVRFIRPGKDGEYIPVGISIKDMPVKLSKTADKRYRAMCIEGAVTPENMIENIDWCAKVGMNGYYLQFMLPFTFFERWFTHERNPLFEGRHITEEEAWEFKKQMVEEIKKRGLEFHACGHGWTCAPYNLPAGGWDKYNGETDEETKQDFALVGGRRELWQGIPINTELCYQKASVRKKMVDFCVSYIKENPEIDIIHFSFSDGLYNQCECDECRKYLPGEFMAMILNDIDTELTRDGIKTKLSVTVYHELLWAPQKVKLNKSERFLLLFCPITRSYTQSYQEMGSIPDVGEYERNKGDYPESVEGNYAYLRAWQKTTASDGISFEYYYWVGEHYSDFGSMNLADVIYRDIHSLEKMRLSGIISCQSQRAFMPTGLGSYVMAKSLFDAKLSFEEITNEYFEGAYGEYAGIFKEHSRTLSDIAGLDKSVEKYTLLKVCAEKFKFRLKEFTLPYDCCHSLSLRYAAYHCDLLIKTAEAELATLNCGYDGALDEWKALIGYVRKTENEVQPVFDVFQYLADLFEVKHTELKKYDI